MIVSPDLEGGNAIASAVRWLQEALLGSIVTTIAIVAIASLGIFMLSGRIDVRRAAHVVFGCFIIFGASTIASGILSAISGRSDGRDVAQTVPPPLPLPPATAHAPSTPYDPYAGAALPPR
jgi:type IV secretory pathway VirB2 component (pilin)